MDSVNQVFEFFSVTTISIPLGQMVLFVIMVSICMVMGKFKLGLLTTYLFVFYWGFIFNRAIFIDAAGNASIGLFAYAFFGLSMAVAALVGFMTASHN